MEHHIRRGTHRTYILFHALLAICDISIFREWVPFLRSKPSGRDFNDLMWWYYRYIGHSFDGRWGWDSEWLRWRGLFKEFWGIDEKEEDDASEVSKLSLDMIQPGLDEIPGGVSMNGSPNLQAQPTYNHDSQYEIYSCGPALNMYQQPLADMHTAFPLPGSAYHDLAGAEFGTV
jgi:hypothetical protein